MYFVHPQTRFKFKNLFKKIDKQVLNLYLEKLFPNKNFLFTDYARSAFRIIIENANLQNSTMLVPAYICDVFSDIFKHYNIQPIFIDIDSNTFNVKISDLEKNINPNVKALLVSHTYGLLNDMSKIKQICEENNLILIEDCAHAFGAPVTGDYVFFSLYKSFPCLQGGLLVSNKQINFDLQKNKFNFYNFIQYLYSFPVCAYLIEKFKQPGKKIFADSEANKIMRRELTPPKIILPLSLKLLAINLKKYLDELENRKIIAKKFQAKLQQLGFKTQESDNNNFTYLSALIPEEIYNKREELIKELGKHKIYCTKIWHDPITDLPNAKYVSQRIINFPLQDFFIEKDMEYIIKKIQLVLRLIKSK